MSLLPVCLSSVSLGVCAFLASFFILPAAGAADELPAFQQAARAALVQLPGARESTPEREGRIVGLGFAQAAAFRALASVPGIEAPMAEDGLSLAAASPITYSQAEAYALFCRLPALPAEKAFQALSIFATLDNSTLKTLVVILEQGRLAPQGLETAIFWLRRLSAPRHWGAQAYFALAGGTKENLIEELKKIAALPETGGWALESCSRRVDADAGGAAATLTLLGRASSGSAWNIRSLCTDSSQPLALVQHLAETLFLLDSRGQDAAFARLPPDGKKLVLKTFHASSQWKAERMNRLHALTDAFGVEYSDQTLRQSTPAQLLEIAGELGLWLDSALQNKISTATDDRSAILRILRQKAAAKRRQTAKSAAAAELYILATEGDELFDSSFRDILVPELVTRMEGRGGLFSFLEGVDPQRLYSDAFFANMAQRGKLARILPRDPDNEKKFLRRIVALAFADFDHLQSFALALQDIFPRLSAAGRVFIVQEAAARADDDPILRPALLNLLAFQRQRQGEYLPTAAIRTIDRLAPDADMREARIVQPSPFAEWTADGRIRILSLFPPDDDGGTSFVSFCRALFANGYKARVTADFPLAAPSALAALTDSLGAKGQETLPTLFRVLATGGAVDFSRSVGGVALVHTLHVIRGRESATTILSWFLAKKIEMLAQRGHSYWRRPQVVNPMTALRDTEPVRTAQMLTQKRRFVSLGSCGGTNAFFKIRRLFLNNVDILATVGTGDGSVNDLYNIRLPEFAARNPAASWRQAETILSPLFRGPFGRDYLQPGDLPSILARGMEN